MDELLRLIAASAAIVGGLTLLFLAFIVIPHVTWRRLRADSDRRLAGYRYHVERIMREKQKARRG